MAYIALKPCRFAGQSFRIGDTIPDELVHSGASKNLVKMNIIGIDGENAPALAAKPAEAKEEFITIDIHTSEGDMPVNVTKEGLQAIFDVLQESAKDTESTIAQMTDTEALLLINICDSRKSVKALAEDRAKAISDADEAEESDQEGEETEGDQ